MESDLVNVNICQPLQTGWFIVHCKEDSIDSFIHYKEISFADET